MVRGIIFAGGYGNRLKSSISQYEPDPELREIREWATDYDNPKCLLTVNGRPLLEYSVDVLPTGLDKITVSTLSSQESKVRGVLPRLKRSDIELRVFDQNRYLDLKDMLSTYRDDLMVMHSDTITSAEASKLLLDRFLHGGYDIVTFAYREFIENGLVNVDGNAVRNISDKVRYVGLAPVIFGFTPATIRGIDSLFSRTTEDVGIQGETSIIREIIREGGVVGYELMPENAFNIDTIEVFLSGLHFMQMAGDTR